jgi:hypothetical protein
LIYKHEAIGGRCRDWAAWENFRLFPSFGVDPVPGACARVGRVPGACLRFLVRCDHRACDDVDRSFAPERGAGLWQEAADEQDPRIVRFLDKSLVDAPGLQRPGLDDDWAIKREISSTWRDRVKPNDFVKKRRGRAMGGFGSGRYSRSGGAPKCEHYACIDLATLRRSHMLKPGAIGSITFRGGEKPDRLLVFTNGDRAGLLFIKRRSDGELGKLFVPFTYTPTAFDGWRAWFCCPGCKRWLNARRPRLRPSPVTACATCAASSTATTYTALPLPVWCQYAALSQMLRARVRLTKRAVRLARTTAARMPFGGARAALPMALPRNFRINRSACVGAGTQP